MPRRKITEDELIDDIQRVGDKLGRTPKYTDYEAHGEHGTSTVSDRLGSWSNALKVAGFNPDESRKQIQNDELLDDIQRVASKVDSTPTRDEYIDHGRYWPETVESRFGSWNDAIEKVGLEPNERFYSRKYTDEEVLADLRRVAAELGQTPTKIEYQEYGSISMPTVKDRFGRWNDALKTAGMEPTPLIYTNRELLEDLRRVVSQLNRTPTMEEYTKHGEHHSMTLCRRFGSWAAALDEIGREPNNGEISDLNLLLELRNQADKDRIVSAMSLSDVEYSPSTYQVHFGWWQAVVRAGLQPASGVPLSTEEYQSFIQAAMDISDPTTSLFARLKAFTGLPDRKAIPLNQDWVTRLESDYQDTLITIPNEQLSNDYTGDRDWVVRIPTHYTTPDGDKMPTGIEPLLRWHRNMEGINMAETERYDATKAWHIAAERVGVSVKKHDLRASVVAHLARRGIEGWQIGMQVGSANWERSVEDYLLWLWQFEGYTHPDYELTGVFLDPDSGEPERIESDGD